MDNENEKNLDDISLEPENEVVEDVKDNENTEVSETESLDGKSNPKFSVSLRYWWKYGYYVVLSIIAIILRQANSNITVQLGDFGNIVGVLLNFVALNGFRWIPIISGLGVFATIFEKKVPDISKLCLIVVGLIMVVSLFLHFVVG